VHNHYRLGWRSLRQEASLAERHIRDNDGWIEGKRTPFTYLLPVLDERARYIRPKAHAGETLQGLPPVTKPDRQTSFHCHDAMVV
jgi:hypothetical protein